MADAWGCHGLVRRGAVSDDSLVQITRYNSKLGALNAAGVMIRSPKTGEVKDIVVAFCRGGGPVYVARLDPTTGRYANDRRAFDQILLRFRLEAWR